MTAFHGKPAVKKKYLARVRAHAAADEIISGRYWENGKGCAVGCTLHDPDGGHAGYEKELGIPEVLARLEDRFFETIYTFNPAAAKAWPERFINAPTPGADLSMVFPKFCHWILMDEKTGVIRLPAKKKKKEKNPLPPWVV